MGEYKRMRSMSIFDETILLIKEIYIKHEAGGALHIVLDDGNTENHFIYWCLDNSIEEIKDMKEKLLFERCAKNLLKMSKNQRNKCITKAFNIKSEAEARLKELQEKK